MSTPGQASPAETLGSGGAAAVDPPEAGTLLRGMCLIRAFESRVKQLSDLGELTAATHLSIGHEATIVGACRPLSSSDYVTGTHRSHGHLIAKGSPIGPLMAELFGRDNGVCSGMGGSMHLADTSVGCLGESAIVGGSVPIAVGAAFSAVYRDSGQVALAFFGDGAISEGVVHESLNYAAVWKLPVIFLCENNGYLVSVRTSDVVAAKHLADFGRPYGIPAVTVDGQDVIAVRDAVQRAVERARDGGGPTFIEALTYRFEEHAYGLASPDYRSAEEVEHWRTTRDPITLFRAYCAERGLLTNAEADEIARDCERQVDEAVVFAGAGEDPSMETARFAMFAPASFAPGGRRAP